MVESIFPAPGSVFAGAYRILKQLGEDDGIASFLAEQPGAAIPRTLTILSPRLVEDPAVRARFEVDLRSGANVASDRVARVLDAGVDAATGQPWFTREALKGESLASFAAGRGAITAGEVADLCAQLCHGVAAIHVAGLVHQDLRPETVFLAIPSAPGIAWSVRVLDLGLASFLVAARRTPAVGEPLWMAPEQADARPPVEPPADVWSLGLIAFFLLVGRPYWKGAAAGSMLAAAVHQEVVFEPLVAASTRAAELGVIGRVPEGFDAWFSRCVARLPSERFPDAHAALEALQSTWGAAARTPLPSFALGDRPSPPLPSFPIDGASGPPLPSFPLGFEGASGATPPPHAPGYGPPAPFSGPPPGRSHAPPAWGQPPLGALPPPTWGVAPPPRRSSALPWILAGLALLLLLGVGVIIAGFGYVRYQARAALAAAATPVAVASDEDGSIPISPRDPSWGNRDAPVTIVEFGDFQCPFTKRADATLHELQQQHGPAALRIVWKNNPLAFHKGARPAAIAAMATFDLGGNAAFWSFHDRAFAAQDALVDESFASWALDVGVDMVKWRNAVDTQAGAYKIDTDMALGKAAGVRGTPAFFINGVILAGAQPLARFNEIIAAQETAARAAIAAGTRPEDVYAKLSVENAAKNPLPLADVAAPKDETTVWRVPLGASPSRGPASAPVTIVELGDFQCPFCLRASKTLADVRARFGPKVRIVWKNNPLAFHTHAAAAAELALQALAEQGDAGFWRMHDLLYENQAHLEDADLLGYGQRLHVRGAAAAVAGTSHAAVIQADQHLAASLGATGTPTFFINGRRLTGAQPLEKFAAMIDEEIRHAQEITGRGVAPADVYAEIQKTAKAGD